MTPALPAWSAVVATRNRPEALALSLPLVLAQDPPPTEVLVVDASDDPRPTAAAATGLGGAVRVLRGARGLTRQRNLGLREVHTPIVFFLDDDSILFPGHAHAVLEVYARDDEGLVGAVCGIESPSPPPGFGRHTPAVPYRMSSGDRLRQHTVRRRRAIEMRLVPDPVSLHARERLAALPSPPWLGELDAVPAEWMTGFRMTFRTEAIQRTGFDETLATYAPYEDVDASFSILRERLVVGAHRASVYHHRAPGSRDRWRSLGVTQVLNRAYVVCKHSPPGAAARAALRRHAAFKCLQYAAGARTPHGRERLAGAVAAARSIPALLDAPPEELAARYVQLRDAAIDG